MNNLFENIISLLESGIEENVKLADCLLQNPEYHIEYEWRYNCGYQNLSVAYDFLRNTGHKDIKIDDLILVSVLPLDIFARSYFDIFFLLEKKSIKKHFLFDNDRKKQPKSWYVLKNMVEQGLEPTNENMKDFDIIINKKAIEQNWDFIKTRKIH